MRTFIALDLTLLNFFGQLTHKKILKVKNN